MRRLLAVLALTITMTACGHAGHHDADEHSDSGVQQVLTCDQAKAQLPELGADICHSPSEKVLVIK